MIKDKLTELFEWLIMSDKVRFYRVLQTIGFVIFLTDLDGAVTTWWHRAPMFHLVIQVFSTLFMGYITFVQYPKRISAEKRRAAEKKIWEATVGGWDQEADHNS